MNKKALANNIHLSAKPAISVVMSAFNASSYIDDAIQSILKQTMHNLELIIINDGSTDKTLQKILKYKDSRIVVIDQPNAGLVGSLNKGIALARADIIARQDADDLSLPKRLEIQYKTLKDNPDLVLLGSSIITIDENNKKLNHHHVLICDPEIKQELLIRSPFAHGSVIFRKHIFTQVGGYKKEEWPAEDYGLWLRMSTHGKFANIDSPLYMYRENPMGISVKNNRLQYQKALVTQNQAWAIRKKLTPTGINISYYRPLKMGEERIERIAHNILRSAEKSLALRDMTHFFKNTLILIRRPLLLKKCIRILLIKLRSHHA